MTINGIADLRFGSKDIVTSTRFFQDLGLRLEASSAGRSIFRLDEGSSVELLSENDPDLPQGQIANGGVREIIWGVETAEALERYCDRLSRSVSLTRDSAGTVHFMPDFGIPMGLRVFAKRPVVYAPDPVNAPGQVRRLNSPRKWRRRALPKVLQHAVFESPHFVEATIFLREHLDFRLTDVQDGIGYYLRAPGSNAHHNILLINASCPLAEHGGKTAFHHANFGVEDLDEIMLGANHMARAGWEASRVGLGRHRIDSGLFYYLPCPDGGEVEYGADADCVDDNWVPRRWTVPLFGYAHFAHNLPPFFIEPPKWEVGFLDEDPVELRSSHTPPEEMVG